MITKKTYHDIKAVKEDRTDSMSGSVLSKLT